jgi:hypothetical protein
MRKPKYPIVTTQCVACGLGTITAGEWYMIRREVWEQAWEGRRKSWHLKVLGVEILCVGCLEKRIGRELAKGDFTEVPINNPDRYAMSVRLRARHDAPYAAEPRSRSGHSYLNGMIDVVIDGVPQPGAPEVSGDSLHQGGALRWVQWRCRRHHGGSS